MFKLCFLGKMDQISNLISTLLANKKSRDFFLTASGGLSLHESSALVQTFPPKAFRAGITNPFFCLTKRFYVVSVFGFFVLWSFSVTLAQNSIYGPVKSTHKRHCQRCNLWCLQRHPASQGISKGGNLSPELDLRPQLGALKSAMPTVQSMVPPRQPTPFQVIQNV